MVFCPCIFNILLSRVISAKSIYLEYIYGLNYWDTNTLFLFLFLFLIFAQFFTLYFFIFLKFLFKFNILNLVVLKKQLPATLLIGTIVIHPILFYLCMLVFLFKLTKSLPTYSLNSLSIDFFRLFLVLTLTLMLGGFWGLQSTIWGYFWVNDAVEWLLLFTIMYLLRKIHTFSTFNLIYNKFLLIFFVFNLILIVRLNIFQTRHNFIQQKNISLVLLFAYLCFSLFFFKNSVDLAKSSINFFSYLKLSFLIIVINVNYLITLKFICTLLFFYCIKGLKPRFFAFSSYFHYIFFSFFFLWNIFFIFFYLIYTKLTDIGLGTPYIFNHMYFFQSNYYFFNDHLFNILESVSFTSFFEVFRNFSVIFKLNLSVILNNTSLFLLIPIFFFYVKMVEFRLLYDTKTLAKGAFTPKFYLTWWSFRPF